MRGTPPLVLLRSLCADTCEPEGLQRASSLEITARVHEAQGPPAAWERENPLPQASARMETLADPDPLRSITHGNPTSRATPLRTSSGPRAVSSTWQTSFAFPSSASSSWRSSRLSPWITGTISRSRESASKSSRSCRTDLRCGSSAAGRVRLLTGSFLAVASPLHRAHLCLPQVLRKHWLCLPRRSRHHLRRPRSPRPRYALGSSRPSSSSFGPLTPLFLEGVHIYCGTHSVDVEERRACYDRAYPVTIGDDVWVGGGAKILGGTVIGDGACPSVWSRLSDNATDAGVATAPSRDRLHRCRRRRRPSALPASLSPSASG